MASQSVFIGGTAGRSARTSGPHGRTRRPPTAIPERLRDTTDGDTDVTAPRTRRGQYLNQSFISMIANAGTNATFRPVLDDALVQESEKENTPEGDDLDAPRSNSRANARLHDNMTQSLPGLRPVSYARRRMRETDEDPMSMSQILVRPDPAMRQPSPNAPPGQDTNDEGTESTGEDFGTTGRQQTEASTHIVDTTTDIGVPLLPAQRPESSLAQRLASILGFAIEEDVIAEYPCWLLQSVMLQGSMYITTRHICFYAHLPKQSGNTIKSGYLAKRGKKNPKYRRYWFTLKADILSYYTNASDQYFPSGNIDLGAGTSAALLEEKNDIEGGKRFTVTTHQRSYQFQADSVTSAREWVKQLQKVIFRSHNDGDGVKISIPIVNVLDIENNPVVDFADTFRIRVIDNDETYAIDEYFFSFFSSGHDALVVLRNIVFGKDTQSAPWTASSQQPLAVSETALPPIRSRSRSEAVVTSTNVNSESVGPEDVAAAEQLTHRKTTSEAYRYAAPMERISSASSFIQSDATSIISAAASPLTKPVSTVTGSQILQHDDIFQSAAPNIVLDRHHSDDTLAGRVESGKDNDSPPDEALTGASDTEKPVFTDYRHELSRPTLQHSSSSSTLQEILRAGTYPLHKASGIAGLLKTQSKRMGSMLATGSKGYYEKVSSMWAGERVHYDEYEGRLSDNQLEEREDEDKGAKYGDRFRTHFALPLSERLHATYYGYLHRLIPVYGKIYIGDNNMCFRGLLPGSRTKMILPLKDIENVDKEKGFRFGYSGLVIVVRGHEELFFEFSRPDARDDCAVTLLQSLHTDPTLTAPLVKDNGCNETFRSGPRLSKEAVRSESPLGEPSSYKSSASVEVEDYSPPILFDDPLASIITFKPTKSLNITCLTIGSRGDVQPYIALCKGFVAEGHKPTIATHAEFEPWIRSHGIDFFPVAGDPGEIMKLCVENDMFTVAFFREATSKFRGWIDELLDSSWNACQRADLLIESPSAMGGIHIAEALGIPYFRAFTMPWTRTRAYPHAFAVPARKMGGNYNNLTYVMFDAVFWQATAGQINRWRRKTLKLPATSLERMQVNAVPFLYNFSPAVVAPPLDFNHWVRVTGYWFLDEVDGYVPPKALQEFIDRARRDGKKLVYVGFGSIVVEDPAALTRTVVDAVRKADVRCILSKGWSERLTTGSASAAADVPLPPDIHQIQSAPHDWLFSRIDAAAHHGGAGTTGASLRAGLPTVVKPFFGDQFFFGQRIEDLGVGRCLKKLNTGTLGRALWEATNDVRLIERARRLGEEIRREDGVKTAIEAVWRDLDYAKELVRRKQAGRKDKDVGVAGGLDVGDQEGLEEDANESLRLAETTSSMNPEESWTMVDEGDDED